MKKAIIASVVGIVTSVTMVSSSFGQGFVVFGNYNGGTLNAPVTFATDGMSGATSVTAGEGVGSEFTADLLYSLNGGTSYTLLTQANANAGTAYPTAFFGSDTSTANYGGTFYGPTITIPDYTSGAISFIVQAYNGATYGAAGFWNGQSSAFTLPSIATGQNPAGDFGAAMQGFTVSVPEPATLALAGLGSLTLLAFRRRKA
ncbi:MAG: PEP-CTERM sorting domain-containing protein [Limisphaerales bacterium]